MRKILYSPGYGVGWTTWYSSDNKAKILFMLEYVPFIEALEDPHGDKTLDIIPETKYQVRDFYKQHKLSEDQVRSLEGIEAPLCLIPLLPQFLKDWKEKFGDENYPYMGGLSQLTVGYVKGPVKIEDFAGNERFIEPDQIQWL